MEELALTAFNRGPGTVDRLMKRGRNPDNGRCRRGADGCEHAPHFADEQEIWAARCLVIPEEHHASM